MDAHRYFVVQGSVDVLASDGARIVCSLKSGAYFGEIAFLFNVPQICTVRTRTPWYTFINEKKRGRKKNITVVSTRKAANSAISINVYCFVV